MLYLLCFCSLFFCLLFFSCWCCALQVSTAFVWLVVVSAVAKKKPKIKKGKQLKFDVVLWCKWGGGKGRKEWLVSSESCLGKIFHGQNKLFRVLARIHEILWFYSLTPWLTPFPTAMSMASVFYLSSVPNIALVTLMKDFSNNKDQLAGIWSPVWQWMWMEPVRSCYRIFGKSCCT